VKQPVDPATIHRHDGFYLRMGIGVGYLWNKMTAPNSSDYTVRGTVLPLELLIGGSAIPGLALGGGLWINPGIQFRGNGPSSLAGGLDSKYDLMFVHIGPFVDYYFDPTQGLHVLAAVGLGGFNLTSKSGIYNDVSASGFALTGGIGQEFWISNQWSVGILGRITYASLEDSSEGVITTHRVITPAILATFTLN
jgi:opacity protein-like surface antigen